VGWTLLFTHLEKTSIINSMEKSNYLKIESAWVTEEKQEGSFRPGGGE
jgi:hypothetical protein